MQQNISPDTGAKAVRELMLWAIESSLRMCQLDDVLPSVLHRLAKDAINDCLRPNYAKNMLDDMEKEFGMGK